MKTDNIIAFVKHAGLELIDSGKVEIALLAGGGSDRGFYRVNTGDGSFIVMMSPVFSHEIRAYIDVGSYLYENKIGVPEIIAYDDESQMVLLEDLGDESLYILLRKAKTRKKVKEYYKKALIFLAEMQIKSTPSIFNCSYLKHRTFGYEALRWETDYFIECFVKRFSKTEPDNEDKLESELHRLALTLSAEPRYFMHRDFQSQNIYFKRGKVRVIDFQTATMGLLQYDLVSLLKDSYFELNSGERSEFLHYYIDLMKNEWGIKVNEEDFIRTFHLAGLQRNMQALGAFAYLSMEKGKTVFLTYIPAAVSSLKDALYMFPEFTELKEVVKMASCSAQVEKLFLSSR